MLATAMNRFGRRYARHGSLASLVRSPKTFAPSALLLLISLQLTSVPCLSLRA